jgi:hypothetical protein
MPELIDQATAQVRPRQWTRTHTIWALIVLSLLPGGAIAMFRDHWLEMPAGVKGAVYLTSAMLIIAAIGLMMRVGDRSPDDS